MMTAGHTPSVPPLPHPTPPNLRATHLLLFELHMNFARNTVRAVRFAPISLVLICGVMARSTSGQFTRPQKKQSYFQDVPYTYNGQQFVIRSFGGEVHYVLADNKTVLILSMGNVVAYPGTDAHIVANAEDALKAFQAGTPSGSSAPATGSAAASGLTVDGVISLIGAGLSDDIIVQKINQSGQSFNLSTDDLVRLKKAKASDTVIKAMMDAKPGATPAAAPVAASVAAPTVQPVSATPAANPPPPKKEGFFSSIGHGVTDTVQGKTVIDKVGLRNVLPEWDPHKSVADQFPHVAITVISPAWNWTQPYMTTSSQSGFGILAPCYKLKATVWTDADHSRTVGPFNWCAQHDEMITQLEPTYLYSLNPGAPDMRGGYLTGINRTDGPAPPDKLLPNDRETLALEAKTNPEGRSKDLNLDQTSQFALMFANVRRDMGETLNADGDYRVWVVSIGKKK